MAQREHSGRRETNVLKPDEDIDQHQEHGDHDCQDRGFPHLFSDGCGNGFGRNAALFHAKGLRQFVSHLCSLVHIERAGLDDDFVGADNLLHGYIGITGHFHDNRFNLFVEFRQRVVFVKANRCGCTAQELQREVEGAVAAGRIEDHAADADHKDAGGNNEIPCPLAGKIKMSKLLRSRPGFRIIKAKRMNGIAKQP